MKILFASDVHYPNSDRTNKLFSSLKQEPDLLVLAGDVFTHGSHEDLRKFLRKLRKVYEGPLVAVPGNHEHWLTKRESRDFTSQTKVNKLAEIYRELGGTLLQVDGPYPITHDLSLVGTTGWYDYSFARDLNFSDRDFENCNPHSCSREEIATCEKRGFCDCRTWFNDCVYVNLGISNEDYLQQNVKILEDQLRKVRRAIVVLHHVPRKELVVTTGDRYTDFFLAFDGSERLDEVVRRYEVEYVIYGHLHDRSRQDHVVMEGVHYVNAYNFFLLEL
ncbi:MAG: metallophosphoesterase [Metallosphaera prunae]|uniref:metallophosphoesterase n=1 Tax=Metallosphaera prunae TaxID=47304 RepID=UPI00227409D0|nr:metallophosphoesterase [Metallosphaera prunae]MCY0862433.1 metallophosphoesterase [Metallosphaera prunae]